MELNIEVPATYPPGCKIVFVGEAPGKEEVDAKEGFVGASGRALQKACSIAGIDWQTVGRSNVCKHRPPDNNFRECFYETIEEPVYTTTGKLAKRTKKVTRKTQELVEWENFLYSELKQQKPNLVVACGNEALQVLTEASGITNYRGSILEARSGLGFKVLATEHPSYIIRSNMLDFWILVFDLKKAKREMEYPEIRRESWTQYTADKYQSKDEFKAVVMSLLNEIKN